MRKTWEQKCESDGRWVVGVAGEEELLPFVFI